MEDTVLLKIKRQFTHDEAIAFVQNELSKARFNNGELQSEIAELKDVVRKLNRELLKPKVQLSREDLKDERIVKLNKKLSEQGEKIKKLQKEVIVWRDRYFNIKNASNQPQTTI